MNQILWIPLAWALSDIHSVFFLTSCRCTWRCHCIAIFANPHSLHLTFCYICFGHVCVVLIWHHLQVALSSGFVIPDCYQNLPPHRLVQVFVQWPDNHTLTDLWDAWAPVDPKTVIAKLLPIKVYNINDSWKWSGNTRFTAARFSTDSADLHILYERLPLESLPLVPVASTAKNDVTIGLHPAWQLLVSKVSKASRLRLMYEFIA